MAAFTTPAPVRKSSFAPAGIRTAGDGSYFVTVKGHITGPTLDVQDAMTVARWLNDGGFAEIELAGQIPA